MQQDKILCAVWMVTYNHEAYIAQAIEGVMMQQTDFFFKLYIGEDGSTDDTAKICKSYQTLYPGRIELILHPVNVGIKQNAKSVYEACLASGAAYIAMCEGDDYWTDPKKLSLQVSYLENNKDIVLCWTNGYILHEGDMKEYILSEKIVDIKEILKGNKYLTGTVVFKSKAIFPLPKNLFVLPFGDFALYVWMLRKKRAKGVVLPQLTAVYRKHKNGIHSLLEQNAVGRQIVWERHLLFYKTIKETWLLGKYNKEINEAIKQLAIYLQIDLPQNTETWLNLKLKKLKRILFLK